MDTLLFAFRQTSSASGLLKDYPAWREVQDCDLGGSVFVHVYGLEGRVRARARTVRVPERGSFRISIGAPGPVLESRCVPPAPCPGPDGGVLSPLQSSLCGRRRSEPGVRVVRARRAPRRVARARAPARVRLAAA